MNMHSFGFQSFLRVIFKEMVRQIDCLATLGIPSTIKKGSTNFAHFKFFIIVILFYQIVYPWLRLPWGVWTWRCHNELDAGRYILNRLCLGLGRWLTTWHVFKLTVPNLSAQWLISDWDVVREIRAPYQLTRISYQQFT